MDELPRLEALQSPEQVRMFGGFCSARLAEVGKAGPFPVAVELERFLDVLVGHADPNGPVDMNPLMRFYRLFVGDDTSVLEYYQGTAVGLALLAAAPMDEPLLARAKRLMFTSFNAWDSLDDLTSDGSGSALLAAEIGRQSANVADIVERDDSSVRYLELLAEARASGGSARSAVVECAVRLGWTVQDGRAAR